MPTLLFDVDAAALTDAGAGVAGSTTGVPPLTDVQGGVWSNDATNIIGTESAGGNGWERDILANLAHAACVDQRQIMTIVAGTDHAITQGMAWLEFRYRLDAGVKKHYAARLDNDGVQWYWIEGATANALTKTFFATALVAGTTYDFEGAVIGTTYSWDVRVPGGASNFAGAQSATDATAGRQTAGHMGSNTGVGASPMKFRRLRGWDEGAAVASAAVTPDPITASTVTAMTAQGTGTAWDGTTTITADVGTITNINRLDADTITFDYSAPAGTATFTITTGAQALTDAITVNAPTALTAGGPLLRGASTGAAIVVTGDPAGGGSGAIAYDWRQSVVQGAGWDASTPIAGATGQTLTWGDAVYGRVYYFLRRATDGAGATAITGEVAAALRRNALVIGIGPADSLDADDAYAPGGIPPAERIPAIMERMFGIRGVTVVNRAVSGTTTADWQTVDLQYTNARDAYIAAGVKYVLIRLGANDSRLDITPAAYQADMQATCDDLVANGITPILIASPYIYLGGQWGAGDVERQRAYIEDAQAAIANGTTIFRDDRTLWVTFLERAGKQAGDPNWTTDGVHLTDTGAQFLAEHYVKTIATVALGYGQGGASGTIILPDAGGVSPAEVAPGSPNTAITLTVAAGITTRDRAFYNGAERTVTGRTATTLTFTALASDLDTAGGANIVILRP